MAVTIKKGQALGALSLTPLIDVVFLLLIFFLVASRLSQEDRELPIPLPSAANAVPMTEEPQELVVNIDSSGGIFVNNKQLRLSELEALLKQTMANNPIGQNVIIRADKRVPFQTPVSVMDMCLAAGASYSATTTDENTQ